MNDNDPTPVEARQLTWLMMVVNGPLLAGDQLSHTLGYGSGAAMRKANSRGTTPVTLMELPHRKLRFALSDLVAGWLIEQRMKHSDLPIRIPVEYGKEPSSEFKLFLIENGYLLHEKQVLKCLNIHSREALLELHSSGACPIPLFRIDGRQTKLFALSAEAFEIQAIG